MHGDTIVKCIISYFIRKYTIQNTRICPFTAF